MLADMAEGRIDLLIVWHLDRFRRHPKELEEFFAKSAIGRVSATSRSSPGEVAARAAGGVLVSAPEGESNS